MPTNALQVPLNSLWGQPLHLLDWLQVNGKQLFPLISRALNGESAAPGGRSGLTLSLRQALKSLHLAVRVNHSSQLSGSLIRFLYRVP